MHPLVQRQSEVKDAIYYTDDGVLHSVYPAETMFGYFYFSHLIPPFKPENVLILGYGFGTVAELIRRVWGADVAITGVDQLAVDARYLEYKLLTQDAYDYVRECTDGVIKKRYDYVVIDLFNGKLVPEFVFEVDFAKRIREMTKRLLAINVLESDIPSLKPYYDHGFQFDKVDPVEGNRVVFWSPKPE